jgi:gas vesicle protein
MNEDSKTIVALLTGLVAGAALGILLAPNKGIEIREKISASLKGMGASIRDTAATEIDNLIVLKDKFIDNIKEKMYGTEEEYPDDLEHA